MMAEVFVVCFLLVACKGGNQSSSNEDDDTLSIRLAVLPTLDCLPYYYARWMPTRHSATRRQMQ